ncbi:MAG: YihY/virulence factor BrkB family protein [Bacteroidales bacterium]
MKDLLDEIMGFYRWFIKFITLDIWNLNINDFGKAKRRFIRYLKVAIITIKKSGNDKLGLYAVSLSFFSTMAVVPFAAVAFVVTGGLGLERRLQELLLESFSENTEVLQWVIQFADNIVASSRQGLFGVISFIFFIGTVVWLILSIEKAFNDIWKVERARSIAKRFLYYIGILVVAPFIITIFLSVTLVFNNALDSIGYGLKHVDSIGFALQWLLFYGIVLVIFAIMYKYIPNVKVHFSASFSAAIITSLAFIIVQYLYMETQLFVSRLNAIYGAFAAIPLFLIWMDISWTIILIGAEISHAYQYADIYNIDNYKNVDDDIKKKIIPN